jgi:hypothetical protein
MVIRRDTPIRDTAKEMEVAKTIYELIEEGSMSWGEGVQMFRAEFNVSVTYCVSFGVWGYFKTAEANRKPKA